MIFNVSSINTRATDHPDSSSLLIWVQKTSFPSEDAPVVVCCFGWGMQEHAAKNICEDTRPPPLLWHLLDSQETLHLLFFLQSLGAGLNSVKQFWGWGKSEACCLWDGRVQIRGCLLFQMWRGLQKSEGLCWLWGPELPNLEVFQLSGAMESHDKALGKVGSENPEGSLGKLLRMDLRPQTFHQDGFHQGLRENREHTGSNGQ